MTSQRDETTGRAAGEELSDDPIIIERRDEILTGAGEAEDGTGEDGTASDELIGRPAAPDAGGADPAPLVVPPEETRTGLGSPYEAGPAAGTDRAAGTDPAMGTDPAHAGSAVPGSAVPGPPATSGGPSAAARPAATETADPAVPGPAGAGDPAAGATGPGIPAAALSEQQWPAIQALFVDDPKGSVQRAAAAADEVASAFVASLQREQAALRLTWEDSSDITTEDLRTALQQYRAFCSRLTGSQQG